MCPQKWYASASPGLTSDAVACAPASAITPAPTRERNPRREVPVASASTASPARLGTDRPTAPLGRGEYGLELRARVEGPLREHRAVGTDGDRERAAGDVGERPRVGVGDLVEAAQLDHRVARERRDRRLEGLADVTALGREDR